MAETTKTVYTVRRLRISGKQYGPEHGSMTGDRTVCGEYVDSNWIILSNDFSGTISCARCLKCLSA
jgi:hypothetical protein